MTKIVRDNSIKALNWLSRNKQSLLNFLDGRDGPFGDEAKDLKDILSVSEDTTSASINRHIFIVCIEAHPPVNEIVVDNYVNTALRRFDALSKKNGNQPYFDSMPRPSFRVERIKPGDGTIREIVYTVNQLNNFMNGIDTLLSPYEE